MILDANDLFLTKEDSLYATSKTDTLNSYYLICKKCRYYKTLVKRQLTIKDVRCPKCWGVME